MRAVKNIRLENYDYSSNGYYFVTITSNYKHPHLDKYKNIIQQVIDEINQTNGAKIDYYTIMSDHIHLIIILNDCHLHLGEIIRRLKAKTSKLAGFKLWQPNYYEHIIRNEEALLKIREYIQNNPLVEEIDFKQFYGAP